LDDFAREYESDDSGVDPSLTFKPEYQKLPVLQDFLRRNGDPCENPVIQALLQDRTLVEKVTVTCSMSSRASAMLVSLPKASQEPSPSFDKMLVPVE
jgi:hypothetical protein